MKVGIFTFGSRGDVQPFLALAVGLRQAGHDAFLCAPPEFAELVARYDVPFRAMSLNFKDLKVRRTSTETPSDSLTGFLRTLRRLRVHDDVINRDALRLLADAEAIVYAPLTFTAQNVADKLAVPGVLVCCLPLDPSRELAAAFTGMRRRRAPIFNRLASEIGYRVMWRALGRGARRLRRDLSLPPLPFFGPLGEFARTGQPVFYTFSPSLLPRPSDWRSDVHVVGFTSLDAPADWVPPPELLRFLEAGPAPVFIGFGSMPNSKAADTTALLVEAIERSGQRAILQGGQAGLGDGAALPESVFPVGDLPHSWLFPRVAAVMHHGGAGTTGAAFRAGVPQIVVPHFFDQPLWAQCAFELGVSPKPFRAKQLSVNRAAEAIQVATTDRAMQRRAAEIAAKVRAEDGVGQSVRLIEQYAARFRSHRAGSPAYALTDQGS